MIVRNSNNDIAYIINYGGYEEMDRLKDDMIIKVAGLKMEVKEAKKEFFENNNHYIIRYKTIYQVFYSVNAGFYANEIYYNSDAGVGYTLKGRYIWSDASFINRLAGFKLLHEHI